MTTTDLIKLLQEIDPEGDTEVCIGNTPIWYVERLPAYYDGRLMKYTPELVPYEFTNIEKIELVSDGYKVNLITYEWDSAMWDSDGEVIFDVPDSNSFKKVIGKCRKQVLDYIEKNKE